MRLPGKSNKTEEPRSTDEPERLPRRWALILLYAALGGSIVGTAAGPAAGIAASITVIGVLHAVVR
jgi:hypothetical protein